MRSLEARDYLLDDAFQVVELDGPGRVKRALLRRVPSGGECERGALFHFFSGAAEDGAEFEQAHIVDVTMEVAGDMRQDAGNQRGTQHAGFFAERIAERNDLAGLRRGERSFGGGAEGAGDGFVESGGEQSAADGGFSFGPGQRLHAFAECGQRVGEAVVAVDAGDFFDEVDFAFEVEAPAGKRDLPSPELARM